MPDTDVEPTLIRPAITAAPFVVTGRLLDQVPEVGQPFANAFSVRRIYTGYTGPCMRVRRSSDNVEIDIGFVQTVLDTELLERHCAGFDGFVTVWYDQTGRGRHARQTVWSDQPQIVRAGSILRDDLGNFAIEFNGSFLDTGWEPKESEVGEATAMMMVGSAGLGNQGQVGTLEINDIEVSETEPLNPSSFPEYPNDKLPIGYDTFLLDSKEIAEQTGGRKLLYHGRDKKISIYDTENSSVEETGVVPPQGPTMVTAELLRVGGDDASDVDARGGAAIGNVAWGEAVEGADGKVYGIPMTATRILAIDPNEDDPEERAKLLDIAEQAIEGTNKWFTGILSENTGCIVCPPYNEVNGLGHWLVIDTNPGSDNNGHSKLVSANLTGGNFSRGVAKDSSERIYAAPFNTSRVMILDLSEANNFDDIDDSRIKSEFIPAGDKRGNRQLFSDIVCAGNDRFYLTPWDAGTAIEIEPNDSGDDTLRARGNFGIDLDITNQDGVGEGYHTAPRVRLLNPELNPSISNPSGISDLEVDTVLSITDVLRDVEINNPGSGFLGTTNPNLRRRGRGWNGGANVDFAMGKVYDEAGIYRGYGLADMWVTNMGDRVFSSGVTFDGGKGREAQLSTRRNPEDLQGRIISVEVDDGGSGYFYGPHSGDDVRVVIDPPFPNALEFQIATAVVDRWDLVNPNEDSIEPPSGWKVGSVRLTNNGENYTRNPRVRLVRGDGGSLRGENISVNVRRVKDHHIFPVTIINAGSGFKEEPDYDPNEAYWNNNQNALFVQDPSTAHPDSRIGGSVNGSTRAILRISQVDTDGAITEIQVVNSGRGYNPAFFDGGVPTVSINQNSDNSGSGAVITVGLRQHGWITGIDQIPQDQLPNDLGYLYPPGLQEASSERRIGSNTPANYVSRLRQPNSTEPVTRRWIKSVYSKDQGIVSSVPYDAWRVYYIQNTGETDTNPTFQFFQDGNGNQLRLFGGAKFSDVALDTSGAFAYASPERARRVLQMDLGEKNARYVGPRLRGVYSGFTRSNTGILYGFPSSSLEVLLLDPTNVNDIDELSFGNLNFPGRKITSAITLQNGLIYGVPDQIPVSLELNPGVPLERTPSLPPPHVTFRFEAFSNEHEAVLYSPTPEQGENPALRAVILLSGEGVGTYETIDFPVQKPNQEEIPWFGESVVAENSGNPLALFVPFYNVNSDYGWEKQRRIMGVELNTVRSVLNTYLVTFVNIYNTQIDQGNTNEQATNAARASANTAILESIQNVSYWWSDAIPRELAPPYPSRSVVSVPALGSNVIGWVPNGAGTIEETNTETFVTYESRRNKDDTATIERLQTSRGDHFGGSLTNPNENGKRESERVSWATVGITNPDAETTGSFVTISYEAPARAGNAPTDPEGELQPNVINRHTRGVYVDGIIYAAPRGSNDFYRYNVHTGETLLEGWEDQFTPDIGFFRSSSSPGRSVSFGTARYADTVYVPQTREIYAIPENARFFTVWPLDTEERFEFGRVELEQNTGLSNPQFSMGTLTPNNRIACLPKNHKYIVLIDPAQPNLLERLDFSMEMPVPEGWTMELTGGEDEFEDVDNKNWYRYSVTIGDYIYCIPWEAKQILRIDAINREAKFMGTNFADVPGYETAAWGQGVLYPDGNVYCPPVNNDSILKFYVDENGDVITELLTPDLPLSNGQLEGGMLGNDNLVYFTHRGGGGRGNMVVVYNPVTNITTSLGEFRLGEWQETSHRHQNIVKIEDGRMFAVPHTVRTFAEIVPNSTVIRTYDVTSSFETVSERKWVTEPLLVQKQFRLGPKRIKRPQFPSAEIPFLAFVNDNGYAIYDYGEPLEDTPRLPVLSFSPGFRNGIVGLFGEPSESQDITTIVFRDPEDEDIVYERIDAKMLNGAIAGVRSASETSNLNMVVEENDWVSYIGDGDIRIQGLFDVVFTDRETGAFSVFARGGRSNQVTSGLGQLTTFVGGVSIGQRSYGWEGNASGGSTFNVGRVFQPPTESSSNAFNGTFTGKIQELVVFQSNQARRVRTLAENQTFAYGLS